MVFLVHKIYLFIENENNKEEHEVLHNASMFLLRIIMALVSGIFSYFFINFLIIIFVILYSGESIGFLDIINLILGIVLAIVFISLTFLFLLLSFIELKNMIGTLKFRGTKDQEVRCTTIL